MTECLKSALWFVNLFKCMNLKIGQPLIYADNQGAIEMAKNPVSFRKTKHMELKLYFLKNELQNDSFILKYICTDDNVSDLLTKAIPESRMLYLLSSCHLEASGGVKTHH